MGTWGNILVFLGSRGTPNGHIKAQISFLSIWECIWGAHETYYDTFWDSCMFWVANIGHLFQVHVFGDPGVKLRSEYLSSL